MLFFWFFKICELIRDSSLWLSNFIPSVCDSIIIIGSRSTTYTFGSHFTYKRWVNVLSKYEFYLSWANIPILFVGSQSVSIEIRNILLMLSNKNNILLSIFSHNHKLKRKTSTPKLPSQTDSPQSFT